MIVKLAPILYASHLGQGDLSHPLTLGLARQPALVTEMLAYVKQAEAWKSIPALPPAFWYLCYYHKNMQEP